MTIPYFESYNGKRPIVKRVPECRPDGLLFRNNTDGLWWFPLELVDLCVDDVMAAALTRDAIKCWAAECEPTNSRWARLAEDVLGYTDHAEVNAAAHALADALGVEP